MFSYFIFIKIQNSNFLWCGRTSWYSLVFATTDCSCLLSVQLYNLTTSVSTLLASLISQLCTSHQSPLSQRTSSVFRLSLPQCSNLSKLIKNSNNWWNLKKPNESSEDWHLSNTHYTTFDIKIIFSSLHSSLSSKIHYFKAIQVSKLNIINITD